MEEEIRGTEYVYGSHLDENTEAYPVLMLVIYKQNQKRYPLVVGFTTNLSKFMKKFFDERPNMFKDIVMNGDACTFTNKKDGNRGCMYTSPIYEGQCVLMRFGEEIEQRLKDRKITD